MIIKTIQRLRDETRHHQHDVAVEASVHRRRSIYIASALVVAATLWVTSGVLFGDGATGESVSPQTAQTEEHLASVRVMPSTAQLRTRHLVIKGATAASRNITLRAEVAGRVTEILAEKGASIADGGAVLRLDAADRVARVAEAEALVRQRELEYNAARKLGQKSFASEIKVSTAKAQFNAAEAILSLARKELNRTVVRAPYAGTLATRTVEVGDYVKIGDPVGSVVTLDPLKIVAEVTERHVTHVQEGAQATAVLLDGRTITGTVTYVAPVANTLSRTFTVEIEAANPNGTVQDGLTAEVRLPLETAMAHKISPAVLSLSDEGVLGVKTIEIGDLARFHAVEILADEGDGMWITGLPDQTTLITVGQEYVGDGQHVRPIREDSVQ